MIKYLLWLFLEQRVLVPELKIKFYLGKMSTIRICLNDNRVQQLRKTEHPHDDFDRGICFFFGTFISQIFFKKKGITLLESKKEVCYSPTIFLFSLIQVKNG